MAEHDWTTCPHGESIRLLRTDIAALRTAQEDMVREVDEMSTVLFGAERNGGGFLRHTSETMEIVRLGVGTIESRLGKVETAIDKFADKRTAFRKLLTVVLPPLVGAGVTIATLLLTRAP